MKEHESTLTRRTVTAVVVLICVLASCTGDADPVASPTDVAATVTPDDEVEPTVVVADPTVTPVPVVVPDDERIAAAYAAFDADPDPAELVAWDFSDPTVNDAGLVSFRICGWDGEGVFDQMYDAVYETSTDDAGTITTRRRDVALSSGDCLNTALLDSALAFVNEAERFYVDAYTSPSTFATDPRVTELLTPTYLAAEAKLFADLAAAGSVARGLSLGRGLPDSAIAGPIGRRYETEGLGYLDVAFCQEMDPSYGTYQGTSLEDDFKAGLAVIGPHAVNRYVLSREGKGVAGWRLDLYEDLAWADCFLAGDFAEGVASWRPEPTPWIELTP